MGSDPASAALIALLLGLVQGATEFLPISSSAHLYAIPYLFGISDPLFSSLAFAAVIHLGTLAAVLVSPAFLFLNSPPPISVPSQLTANERHNDATAPWAAHQLASRLSYLLWLSPPDDQLSARADDGSLLERDVLLSQAQRLLADPRSRRLLESFCRQWLRLDKLSNIAVNHQTYPTYDEDFAELSVRETVDYFVDVFTSDSSALDLIDSNYAMLNDRLADHYQVNDGEPAEEDVTQVIGGELRRVQLPHNSVRGGLLTQASVMTMNSDGVDSHPIRRGVWLLDRLMNQPPPKLLGCGPWAVVYTAPSKLTPPFQALYRAPVCVW